MKVQFSRIWTVLGTMALLLSGFLALIVTGAKAPGLKELLPGLDIVRWCLVVHVNLATLIWFTAIPAGLVHLALAESEETRSKTRFLSHLGLGFALVGIVLMLSVPPGPASEPILANYIPVLNHPRYLAALAYYIFGIALTFLSPAVLRPSKRSHLLGLDEVRFGLGVGAMYIVMSAVSLGLAYMGLRQAQLVDTKIYFELGMWGGGHLMQHASTVFLLCCWVILLSYEAGNSILTRRQLYSHFALLALPVLVVPALWTFPVTSTEYRTGFTMLMRWGIAPASLLLLCRLLKSFKFSRESFKGYRVIAFAFSAFLLVLGFVFGAFIRGADMRVPGHYHAGIGAITLTFMATALHMLAKEKTNRWMVRMCWTYGCGQSIFASGMFIAGCFGMGRKTYGAEHMLTNWGQKLGFGMIAVGGLTAFAGGIFFALAVWPYLRESSAQRLQHSLFRRVRTLVP